MSDSVANTTAPGPTGDPKPEKERGAASPDRSSEDSSSDSDGSSGSSSSGDRSSERSTTDSARTDNGPGQSDGAQSEVDHENQLSDSSKSLNVAAKIDENLDSPELNVTPAKFQHSVPVATLAGKELVDESLFATPCAGADLPMASVHIESSPIPITPAKQMEWSDLVADLNAPVKVPNDEVSGSLKATPVGRTRAVLSPGELSSPVANLPMATVVKEKAVKALADQVPIGCSKLDQHESSAREKKASRSSKARHLKDQAVLRAEENSRQLELQLIEIRELKAKVKLESKKRKLLADRKHKRAKKKKPRSSDDARSSASSVSNEPATSTRISRIPNGRKYQRIAMSRAKQLGLIVLNDSRGAGVVAGAKLIANTEFVILPTHSYQNFHQVPGTGLPHIIKLVRDVNTRYAPFVKAIAQLHLNLAIEYRQSRNRLVVLDEGTPYTSIWTMENDLTRASDKPEVEMVAVESTPPAKVQGPVPTPTVSLAAVSVPTPVSAPTVAVATPSSAVASASRRPQEVKVVAKEVSGAADEVPKTKSVKKKKKDSKPKHQ